MSTKQQQEESQRQLEASERLLEEAKVRENVLKTNSKVIVRPYDFVMQPFMVCFAGASRRITESPGISRTFGTSTQSRDWILEYIPSH
jgi:hypothetical protein